MGCVRCRVRIAIAIAIPIPLLRQVPHQTAKMSCLSVQLICVIYWAICAARLVDCVNPQERWYELGEPDVVVAPPRCANRLLCRLGGACIDFCEQRCFQVAVLDRIYPFCICFVRDMC